MPEKYSFPHCKFHISWRLFNANYYSSQQFFVFTLFVSTNQRAPLFNQSAPSSSQPISLS